jgi:putative endonuclease
LWFVYILECADGTYYTGIAKDYEKRVNEHNTSPKGAKYTRGRRPVRLLYHCSFETRSEALKEECYIKKLSRKEKAIYLKK